MTVPLLQFAAWSPITARFRAFLMVAVAYEAGDRFGSNLSVTG